MNKMQLTYCFGILLIVFTSISCKNDTKQANLEAAKMEQMKSHPANSVTNTNKPKHSDPNRKIVTEHLDAGGLKWITMEQASKLKNSEGKKFLVDVYTDWCGWCKIMDRKTFTDPEVQRYLNENFHLVKFNSEQHDPINFKGITYEWAPLGKNGINKLAFEIIGTSLSYPTLVYLDENLEKIKHIPGYKKPEQLMADLKTINNS